MATDAIPDIYSSSRRSSFTQGPTSCESRIWNPYSLAHAVQDPSGDRENSSTQEPMSDTSMLEMPFGVSSDTDGTTLGRDAGENAAGSPTSAADIQHFYPGSSDLTQRPSQSHFSDPNIQTPAPLPRQALPRVELRPPTLGRKCRVNNPTLRGGKRCPYCKYASKRKSDLRRHVEAHGEPKYACIGVKIEDGPSYSISSDTQGEMWKGVEVVGGCKYTFKRRDSYVRHLENEHLTCVGYSDGDLARIDDDNHDLLT